MSATTPRPSWEAAITKAPVVLFPPSPTLRPLTMAVVLAALLSAMGCATTYRGAVGGTAFAPGYTVEQCAQLRKELRTYTATGEGLLYLSGAGAVVTGIALALTLDKAAPAVGAGVSLLATGGVRFTASQAKSLTEELALGGCPR